MTRPPRVFISRTTAGLKALAEQVAEVLRQRGIEPIIQTGFYPSTHAPSMLAVSCSNPNLWRRYPYLAASVQKMRIASNLVL